MATIRQLQSGKWNAQVRITGYKPKSSTHLTREAAEQWAKEQEHQVHSSCATIQKLSPVYLEEVMTLNGKQRGGYEAICHRLRTLSKGLPASLTLITNADVAEYKNKRLKIVQGASVRLELQLLSRFLRWASTEKGIECSDVVKQVKLPSPSKPREKIILPHEYSMILDNVSDRIQPIITLAYETAMRRGEILSLKPSMINFRKRVIHLTHTKNGEERDVPLSTAALALLTQLCEGRDHDSILFPYADYTISQAFRRAVRKCQIHGVCFHSLRHTAITRYAEKGLSTVQLQVISGHKSIGMLARYSHIRASSVSDLMG